MLAYTLRFRHAPVALPLSYTVVIVIAALLAALLLPLLLTYGRVMPSNRILEVIARRVSGHARIYTRCDLPRALRDDACAPPRVGMRRH